MSERRMRGPLTIYPVAGLANRLRAMDSALSLARRLRRPLTVLWKRDTDLNAAFRDLFVVPRGVWVVELAAVTAWARDALPGGALPLPSGVSYDRIIDPDGAARLVAEGWDFGGLAACRAPLVVAFNRFHTGPRPFAAWKPAPALRRMIERHASHLGPRAVGVHLRRAEEVARGPIEAFLAAMRAELAADPRTTFFLATDSPGDEATIRAALGDRVLTHGPKCLDRNDPRGIRDAMIDLYVLARTRRIIGSAGSSFSETAAAIGGCTLRVAGAGVAS